ncbi:hypothetical protein AB0K14_26290 [Actinosynnema sp. NPDC050801]|uniref:hypothetical protein n=1 Tax=unclassified Actinosynnema TaxID=2637065 RepID=UPI0033D0747D
MNAGIVLLVLGGVCLAIAMLILVAAQDFGPMFVFLLAATAVWVVALAWEVRKRRR